ncbi:protein O-mannosyl-transferase TMTC1-like isoform X2 [Daphnia pulicaria]|uniref:protein O-mannosyl-transferase TMTC1-like isoform X2 n=1 Tax=Daphnia pulicaria TaxID=35523 RepID=UPI001EEBD2FF|nr:protein O-mannosyl-transferase TMTC1-like isoform X2 [Daphnia pulicaria]
MLQSWQCIHTQSKVVTPADGAGIPNSRHRSALWVATLSQTETQWSDTYCTKRVCRVVVRTMAGADQQQAEASSGGRFYCLLPLLLGCLVFFNSLGGDFVHDDLSAVRYNEDVTAGSDADGRSKSGSIWSNDFWGTALSDVKSHKSYRPLTVLSFRWNYLVGGFNPVGYHLVNVALHGAVVIIFAQICRDRLKSSLRTSLISASLFAIHSIHTEAVAGIVGRADILATLFFLLSFSSYHRLMEESEERVGRQCFRWASSVVLAWASLTAKEHGIATLPVAVLFDVTSTFHVKHIRLADKRVHRVGDLSPSASPKKVNQFHRIVGTSLAVVSMTLWRLLILNGQLPTFSEQDNPLALSHHLLTRVLSLLYLPAVNMGLLLAPVSLSYDWQTGSIPAIVTWSDGRNAVSFLFYVSLAAIAIVGFIRTNKIVIWSVLVMIIPMVPCSNLFYAVGFVVAERLLYMPSLGFCLLVGHGLDNLLIILATAGGDQQQSANNNQGTVLLRTGFNHKIKRSKTEAGECSWPKLMRRLILISTVVTATSLLTKTLVRNEEWSSRKTLFSSGLRTMPNNAKIHYNYANLQRDMGDWDQAVYHYRQAIQLWPSYSSAHNNLGTLLLGRSAGPAVEAERNRLVDEAERHFRQALAVHFKHVHARYNLAVISICHRHDLDQAVSLLIDCLALDPQHKPAKKLLNFLTTAKAVK